jgi:hypothetical protein
MSELLFGRRYALAIGSTQITRLRVAFRVKKTLTKEPNTAEIVVYNLSESTRRQLQGKAIPVVLSAGYVDNEAVIFSGDARYIDHVREGADWITKIKCGDGERAYQFRRFNGSFAPGTSIADVIRACASALSINTGNLEEALAKPFRGGRTVFRNGFSASGDAIDVLDQLLRGAGFTVSIQNGALQVLQGGQPVPSSAVLLSASTGLVGSPELGTPEKQGAPPRVKAKSLLQPKIVCGGIVELQTISFKGQFRVEALEHTGDTDGGEWYTALELKPF